MAEEEPVVAPAKEEEEVVAAAAEAVEEAAPAPAAEEAAAEAEAKEEKKEEKPKEDAANGKTIEERLAELVKPESVPNPDQDVVNNKLSSLNAQIEKCDKRLVPFLDPDPSLPFLLIPLTTESHRTLHRVSRRGLVP